MSSVVPPLLSAALEASSTIEFRETMNWTFALYVRPRGSALHATRFSVLSLSVNSALAKLEPLRRGTHEAAVSLEGRESMDGALTLAHERLIEAYTALVPCERHAPVGRTIALSHCVLRVAGTTDVRSKERLAVNRAAFCTE